MSRIPAHGPVVVTATISAVLGMCLLGGIAAQASAGTTGQSSTSPAVAKTAMTSTTVGNDDTVSPESSSSSLSSSFMTGTSEVGAPSDVAGTSQQASFGSNLDVGQSLDATANIGLAGLAAEGQMPVPPVAGTAGGSSTTGAVAVQPRTSITGTPRQIAQNLAAARGWNAAQWTCLEQLWQRESKFQTTIRNIRSGAYGIPQALPASRMASAGADWRTNPVTQIQWGLSYISTRYGTGCNAWAHWQHHGWY
jgi:hypothetical protein